MRAATPLSLSNNRAGRFKIPRDWDLRMADARGRVVGMRIYRSREFLFQNLVATGGIAFCLVVTAVVLVMSGVWDQAPVLVAVVLVLLAVILLAPLTITVEDSGTGVMDSDAVIQVSLAGVLRRSIPLADVKRVQRRDYRPLRQFGGWGWRHAWKGPDVAYAIHGSSAVVLTLRNGSEVYLGVDDEPGLLEALKSRIYH